MICFVDLETFTYGYFVPPKKLQKQKKKSQKKKQEEKVKNI
jgi:hypothetical protein